MAAGTAHDLLRKLGTSTVGQIAPQSGRCLGCDVQLFAAKEPLRFSELEKRIEGVNQKMPIQQFKELEKDSIVTRTVYPQVPPKVEYALSERGVALGPSIEALIDWALVRREAMGVASVDSAG